MHQSRFPRTVTRRAQRTIEKETARVFRRTKKEVIRQIRSKLGKLAKDDAILPSDQQPEPQAPSSAWAEAKAGSIAAAIDLSSLDDIIDTTSDQLASVMADAGEEGLKQVVEEDAYRTLVNQVNEKAVQAAKERAAELVGKRVLADGSIIDNPNAEWRIDQPTRDAIRKTIQDGLADNIGSQGIIDNLENDYAFSEERAQLIARTEIANANSYGAVEGYRAAQSIGVKIKKLWQADAEACELCMANEAEGAIDIDAEFESGDDAPPGHPNCECAIVPVVEENEDSDEE